MKPTALSRFNGLGNSFFCFIFCVIVFVGGSILGTVCVRFLSQSGCSFLYEWFVSSVSRSFFRSFFSGALIPAVIFFSSLFVLGFITAPAAVFVKSFSFALVIGAVMRQNADISFWGASLVFLPDTLLYGPASIVLGAFSTRNSFGLLTRDSRRADSGYELKSSFLVFFIALLCVLLRTLITPKLMGLIQ